MLIIFIFTLQGQILKFADLQLEEDCFTHGRLDVGCSCAGASNNLYVYAPSCKVKNIVYTQVLLFHQHVFVISWVNFSIQCFLNFQFSIMIQKHFFFISNNSKFGILHLHHMQILHETFYENQINIHYTG